MSDLKQLLTLENAEGLVDVSSYSEREIIDTIRSINIDLFNKAVVNCNDSDFGNTRELSLALMDIRNYSPHVWYGTLDEDDINLTIYHVKNKDIVYKIRKSTTKINYYEKLTDHKTFLSYSDFLILSNKEKVKNMIMEFLNDKWEDTGGVGFMREATMFLINAKRAINFGINFSKKNITIKYNNKIYSLYESELKCWFLTLEECAKIKLKILP